MMPARNVRNAPLFFPADVLVDDTARPLCALFYERDVELLCSVLNSTPVTVCIPAMRGMRCGLRSCLRKPCCFEALHLSSGRPDHGAIYVG